MLLWFVVFDSVFDGKTMRVSAHGHYSFPMVSFEKLSRERLAENRVMRNRANNQLLLRNTTLKVQHLTRVPESRCPHGDPYEGTNSSVKKNVSCDEWGVLVEAGSKGSVAKGV